MSTSTELRSDLRTGQLTHDRARTGLLFVNPCNDFLSEGGKLRPRVKQVAQQVGLISAPQAGPAAAD
jgi:hypothetical protein